MTRARTVAEQILSAKSGTDARAGDVVICDVDLVLGTDASGPMAIDYFEQMGGERLHDADRVKFARDHYSPPKTASTAGFHDRMRGFVERHGATLLEVGEGIGFQVAVERAWAVPGDLVVGADSHTVTCGALNVFATGVGSSDLAAAMLTGQVWLRVPETIRVEFTGRRPANVSAKDVALALVGQVGAEGANYAAIEFDGPSLDAFSFDDRLVLCNLGVEMGAKAAMCPPDAVMAAYLKSVGGRPGTPVRAESGARYARAVAVDLSRLAPMVARPHSPDNVVPLADVMASPVDMVFIGTCTGGRASDIREALRVLRSAGGKIASSVTLVVTPASREVERVLTDDGTLLALAALGATITTPGCGACCGTSGVIPAEGAHVLSTANRNFKARMGTASASISLASPAACAAAAVTGHITDPRAVGA